MASSRCSGTVGNQASKNLAKATPQKEDGENNHEDVNEGLTATAWARHRGHTAVVALLQAHEAASSGSNTGLPCAGSLGCGVVRGKCTAGQNLSTTNSDSHEIRACKKGRVKLRALSRVKRILEIELKEKQKHCGVKYRALNRVRALVMEMNDTGTHSGAKADAVCELIKSLGHNTEYMSTAKSHQQNIQ